MYVYKKNILPPIEKFLIATTAVYNKAIYAFLLELGFR